MTRKTLVVVLAAVAVTFGATQSASADPTILPAGGSVVVNPDCVQGTVTPGSVSISFSGSTAIANPSGFSGCGQGVSGYLYNWSDGSSSSTTQVTPGETVTVTVSPCTADYPAPYCGAGPSVTSPAATAPTSPGGPGGPGGGSGGPGGPKDSDGDGIPDSSDNCPTVANANQNDADGNGIGDACQTSFAAVNGTPVDGGGSTGASAPTCPPGTLQRCLQSSTKGEVCAPVTERFWIKNLIGQKVMDVGYSGTLCAVPPNKGFTRWINYSPHQYASSLSTYPWDTSVSSPPALQPINGTLGKLSSQWKLQECPFWIGPCGPSFYPSMVVTFELWANGAITQYSKSLSSGI